MSDDLLRITRITRALCDKVVALERHVGTRPPLATASSAYARTCALIDAGRAAEIAVPPPPGRARRR